MTAKELTAMANAHIAEKNEHLVIARDRYIDEFVMPKLQEKAKDGQFDRDIRLNCLPCPVDMVIAKLRELGFTVIEFSKCPGWYKIEWPKE